MVNFKDISDSELAYRLQVVTNKSEVVRKQANDALSELEKHYEEIIAIKTELATRMNEQQ